MSVYRSAKIPSDPKLHHLAALIDNERMRNVFQRYLYMDTSRTVAECHIERIKYKPAKNCQVCYRLIVNDANESRSQECRVYARCFEDGGAKTRYQKAFQDEPGVDKSVLYIPELETVAWVFPYDHKLGHLAKVTNHQYLANTALPNLLSSHFGEGWSIDGLQSEMIRYIPEQTCTVRAKFQIIHETFQSSRKLLIYGKTYYNNAGDRTYYLMDQLWNSYACRDGKLRIPEPMGYNKQIRTLWQYSVPGVVLSDLTNDGPLFLQGIAQAASQISVLHQQRIVGCAEIGYVDLSRQLEEVRRLLKKFSLPCCENAYRVIENLLDLLPTVESEQRAVLHGDLHLKNILYDNRRIYLIDLDNIIIGDPLQEIGSFVATILNLGMVKGIPAGLVDQTIKAFLSTYGNQVPWPIVEARLRWNIAVALICERVFRGFTRLKSGRMEILDDLVNMAENLIDSQFFPSWLQLDRGYSVAHAG